MPTYDYKCDNCGKVKEFFLPMGHDTPTAKELEHDKEDCPKNKKLSRVFCAVPVHWKDGAPTEKRSATSEKNKKLKKLYNDSKMADMKPI